MRIVIAAKALPVHFAKLMSFGRALHRSGHELLIVAPEAFEPVVARSPAVTKDGVPYRLCDDASNEDRAKVFAEMSHLSNEQAHIQLGNETLVRLGPRAATPGVLRAVREFDPDLVLRDSGQFAGLIAAEQCGIPHAKVRTGSPSTDMSRAYNQQSVTELRAEFGLDHPGAQDPDDEPYLTFVPECLDFRETDDLVNLRRFRVPAAEETGSPPEWLPDGDDPLVFLSFGTVASTVPHYARLYRPLIEALAEMPIRLAVGLGAGLDPAEFAPQSTRVVAREWISQEQAMTRADVLITHGGMRSVLSGLQHGVAQVVSPFFWDHHHNAGCVDQLGAGIAVNGETTRDMLDNVPHALRSLLDDDTYRASAGAAAKEIAALPDVAECASFVESLI